MEKFMLRRLLWVLLAATSLNAGAAEPKLNPQFAAWLNAQTNILSWSADFVQTRKLKAVVQPLMATGHVWFAAPNKFHWELGNPPQTIAVRAPDEMLIFYPKLKRVERFPLAGIQTGQWRDALSLLEAGFPRSQAELESKYNITSQTFADNHGQVVMQPKSEAARRMIPQLKVDFDTQKHVLLATELTFADGSTMRNDFKNPVLNPPIDPKMFSPEIPPDFKVTEPLKSR
jgi:outer membrane lipoprotein-sorting protein